MITSSFVWLSLAVFLPLLCLYLLSCTKRNNKSNLPLPPGPTPLPIIGNLLELGRMPHRSLAHLANTYGPVMSLKLGQITAIIISSPDAARQVLQKNDQSLSGRPVPDAVRYANHHLLSLLWLDSSQHQWKKVRTIIKSQLMTPQSLNTHQELRQHKVKQMIAHIRAQADKGQTMVDIGHAAFGTTLNLLCCTILSDDLVDLNSDVGHKFKELAWSMLEAAGKPNLSDFFPLLAPLDLQGHRRRLAGHLKALFQMFDSFIDRRVQESSGRKESAVHDILDELLQLETQGKIDRDTTKSLLADSFIGGTDTTSVTVEWAMAELLRNPDVMAKARAELAAVIGPGNELHESDISKLPFLQAVAKETFRLHPAGPLLVPHKAITSAQVCGYFVPEGSRVMVNAWAIGRDESVWKDAECFRPERFLNSDVDIRGQHFELIPFGSGRRICPGLPLAYRMVHLMLGSLLNSFYWKLPDGMCPIDLDFSEKFGLTLALASPLLAIPVPLKD